MLIVITRDEYNKMLGINLSKAKIVDSITDIAYDSSDIILIHDNKAVKIKNGKRSKLIIDYNKHPKDWIPKRVKFAKMVVTFTHNISPEVATSVL